MIYFAFMVLASFFGLFYQNQIAEDKRARISYCTAMGLLLTLIAGLRSTAVGGDSGQYARLYRAISDLSWSDIIEKHNQEPLFYFFMKLLSLVTSNYTFLFFVIGTIFAFAISYFIYKYSEEPYISYVMLIPMQFFAFTISGCRQAIVMSLVLLALSLVIKHSYIKFAIVLVISYFIHNSVIFVIPFILLIFLRNKIFSRILFVLGIVLTFVFRNQLLHFIISYVYVDYDIYEDTKGSIVTFVMYFIIVILCAFFVNNSRLFKPTKSSIIRYNISRTVQGDDITVMEKELYQFFEVLLGLGVIIQIFVPLQPNIYRAAMYYQIVSIIIVPKMINNISEKLLRGFALIMFFSVMMLMYFRFTFYAAGANPYDFFW